MTNRQEQNKNDELNTAVTQNKVQLTIAAYIITYVLLFLTHKISPTNLAGPGLDAFVLIIALITSVSLIVRSIYRKIKNTVDGIFIFLHTAGLITLLLETLAL